MSKRVKLEGKGGGSARRSTSSGSNASSKSGDGGGGGGEDNEVEEQQKKSAIAMVKWAEVLTEIFSDALTKLRQQPDDETNATGAGGGAQRNKTRSWDLVRRKLCPLVDLDYEVSQLLRAKLDTVARAAATKHAAAAASAEAASAAAAASAEAAAAAAGTTSEAAQSPPSQAAGGTKGKAQAKARKKPRRAAAAAAAAAVAASYTTAASSATAASAAGAGGNVDDTVYPTPKQERDGGSGRVRFYCPFDGCSHSCLRYPDYKKHYRVHLNIRPYECRHGCGKTFKDTSTRCKHERTHDKSVSYACEFCILQGAAKPRVYTRKDNLKQHQTQAHPDMVALNLPVAYREVQDKSPTRARTTPTSTTSTSTSTSTSRTRGRAGGKAGGQEKGDAPVPAATLRKGSPATGTLKKGRRKAAAAAAAAAAPAAQPRKRAGSRQQGGRDADADAGANTNTADAEAAALAVKIRAAEKAATIMAGVSVAGARPILNMQAALMHSAIGGLPAGGGSALSASFASAATSAMVSPGMFGADPVPESALVPHQPNRRASRSSRRPKGLEIALDSPDPMMGSQSLLVVTPLETEALAQAQAQTQAQAPAFSTALLPHDVWNTFASPAVASLAPHTAAFFEEMACPGGDEQKLWTNDQALDDAISAGIGLDAIFSKTADVFNGLHTIAE